MVEVWVDTNKKQDIFTEQPKYSEYEFVVVLSG